MYAELLDEGSGKEQMLGSRSYHRLRVHYAVAMTFWFAKLRTSDSASRSQVALSGRRRMMRGGSSARHRRGWPGRQRRRSGRWLGAQNAWRGAEAGLWEPSSRMVKMQSWRTTYTSPSGKATFHCGVAEEEFDAGRTTRPA